MSNVLRLKENDHSSLMIKQPMAMYKYSVKHDPAHHFARCIQMACGSFATKYKQLPVVCYISSLSTSQYCLVSKMKKVPYWLSYWEQTLGLPASEDLFQNIKLSQIAQEATGVKTCQVRVLYHRQIPTNSFCVSAFEPTVIDPMMSQYLAEWRELWKKYSPEKRNQFPLYKWFG